MRVKRVVAQSNLQPLVKKKEEYEKMELSLTQNSYLQGRLGNCYFLAAIAGCATGGNDVLLKDICIENYADVGLYGVKFFINGKWATVIVDDRIPCEKVGSGWKPIFASPKVHCVCVKVCVCVCVCSFVCLLVCMSRPMLYAYQKEIYFGVY